MDEIVVEVQEHQTPEAAQVLRSRDGVMLEIEQPETFLSFQDGADRQVPSIQVESIKVHGSFFWGSVDNWNPGGQGGLGKYYIVLR